MATAKGVSSCVPPSSSAASSLGLASHFTALGRRVAKRCAPLVAPVALVCVVLHVWLTVSSWRYTASSLLVIDISPSMALASLALLFAPTNLLLGGSAPAASGPAGSGGAAGSAGSALELEPAQPPPSPFHPDQLSSDVQRRAASAGGAGQGGAGAAGSGPAGALRRVWRKLAQAVLPMPGVGPSRGGRDSLAVSLLQRHGRGAYSLQQRPSMDSNASGPSSPWSTASSAAAAAAHGRVSWRQRLRDARWQPSMSRIMSGQRLHMLETESSASSISTSAASRRRGGSTSYGTAAQQGGYGHRGGGYGAQQGSGGGRGRGAGDHGGAGGGSAYLDLPLVPHSGHLAVDCVRNDTTHGASLADLERAVTPQHLLQFGALLGESSAELALSQAGAEGALGCSPRCLFGATDNEAQCARGWEPIADESCARRGLHYQAWRRYLRKGLYMYKSRTVFEGVTPVQAAAFYFDVRHKAEWDESCSAMLAIPPPALVAASSSDAAAAAAAWSEEEHAYARSAFLYARSRFPAPMAQREYVYARRVWAKADDGGCYVVCKATDAHPAPPPPGCRAVRVGDFVSGTVIRESSHGSGARGPCSEVVTVYFEDSHVASGILNLGIRKALWPMVQKLEAAMRARLDTPHAAPRQRATAAALQEACLRPLAAAAAAAVAAGGAAATTALPPSPSVDTVAAAAAAASRPPLRRCASANGSTSTSPSTSTSGCGGQAAAGGSNGAAAAAAAAPAARADHMPLHPSASASSLLALPGGRPRSPPGSPAAPPLQHSLSARCAAALSAPTPAPSCSGQGLASVPLRLLPHDGDDVGGDAPAAASLASIPPSLMEKLTLSWARPSELSKVSGAGATSGAAAAAAAAAATGPLALAVLRHSLRGPALALGAALALLLALLRAACAAALRAYAVLARRDAASRDAGAARGPGRGSSRAGARVASFPVELEPAPAGPETHPLPPSPPQPPRHGGGGGSKGPRSLAARLALVAVRAVTLPLAHRVLNRSQAAAGRPHAQQRAWGDDALAAAAATPGGGGASPGRRAPPPRASSLSRSDSLGSHATSRAAQHGGREGGAAGTQASLRESEARVRHWLDPVSAPDYLLGQHAELLQHHMALQQLKERRRKEALQQQQMQMQQQVQQAQPAHKRVASVGGGAGGGEEGRERPRPRALVVDGVALTWDRTPAAAAAGAARRPQQPSPGARRL